ncbi:acbd6, partial [Symbiodinium sp. CCMP2592]
DSKTALILAAKQGRVEIVRLLLEAGADKGLKDREDRTAYNWAWICGRYEVSHLLLDQESEQDLSERLSRRSSFYCVAPFQLSR